MSIGKLTSLTVTGDHAMTLGWDDGASASVDLAAVISARKALAPLADRAEFARAKLSDDGCRSGDSALNLFR